MFDRGTDTLHRGTDEERTVRYIVVNAPGLAEHVRVLHELEAGAAIIAAEAVVAALLMSVHIKGEERISLQLQCSRPRLAFTADVDSDGGFRARFTPNRFAIPPGRRLKGMLLAIKSIPQKELYRGVTEIQAQRLDQALSSHMGNSTQTDAVLSISASIDESGHIAHAVGVMVERLPDHPDQPSIDSQTFAQRYLPITDADLNDVMVEIDEGKLIGIAVNTLETRLLQWRCSCGQERVEAILQRLGPDELQDMIEKDGGAEVTCHFCNIAFRVTADRLGQLRDANLTPSQVD